MVTLINLNYGIIMIGDSMKLKVKNLIKLSRCFEAVKDNRYFKKATGWKLTYTASDNSYRSSFRPHIELIVDEETAAQMKKDADDLTESVREFYKGCTYWGD